MMAIVESNLLIRNLITTLRSLNLYQHAPHPLVWYDTAPKNLTIHQNLVSKSHN
jgi:hypothetical protein